MNLAQIAAIAFLLLLAAAGAAAVAIAIVRSKLTPVQWLLWVINYLLCRLLWGARWHGQLEVAAGQGAVIVCNHRSSIDPCFVQAATMRKTHWMVAREFCEHPAFCWFLRTCEVIPTRRGGIDTAATRTAIRIAAEGGLVGMLPEGRINTSDRFMLPARPGAALVALKARVPIIPCYIKGSPFRREVWDPLFTPARVDVHFGHPIDLSEFYGREGDSAVVREAMVRVLKAIAELAGQPDFEPEIAGRKWRTDEEVTHDEARTSKDERAGGGS